MAFIRKTGQNLGPGEIVATKPGKGVQLEVKSEGRYFKNPFVWEWRFARMTDIPAASWACNCACSARTFPGPDHRLRRADQGRAQGCPGPGKHMSQPTPIPCSSTTRCRCDRARWAWATSLDERHPLTSTLPAEKRTGSWWRTGSKGVTAQTLDPGTYGTGTRSW